MQTEVWGRDVALTNATRFVGAAAQSTSFLTFTGEPGIGKTTLWQAVVDMSQANGHQVLRCRPGESEVSLAHSGLTDLLATVPDTIIESLPTPQRHALAAGLLREGPAPRLTTARVLATAFLTTLRKLAEAAPLVIAIDDIQWLDAATWRLLDYAVRRLEAERIGVLSTVRSPESELAQHFLRSLPVRRTQVIRLGGLGNSALNRILRNSLGHQFPRPVVARIAAAAAGNPLFAIEIGRATLDRPAELAGALVPPLPDDLRQLLVRRLRRLPTACQRALLVAAAQNKPIAGSDASALAAAEDAGVVVIVRSGRVRFTHPLLAAAIYSSASATARRAVHRQLAAQTDDLEERARHLALSTDGPDEETAATLSEAAARLSRRGAPAAAADLLELALSLTIPDSASRVDRLLTAAECHFHAGDRARARSLATQVADAVPVGPRHGQALRLLGLIRYHEDSYPEAVALLERAAAELAGDPLSVDVWGNLAHVWVSLNDFARAGQAAQRGLLAARRFGDRAWEGSALAVSAMADVFIGQPPDWRRIARSLRMEDADHQVAIQMRPSWIAGAMHLYHDDFAAARRHLVALRQRMIDRDEDSDLPFLSFHLSMVERGSGNLALAMDSANEAYNLAAELGSQNQLMLALGERCYVRALVGDTAGAREDAERGQALVAQSHYPAGAGLISGAAGFLELSLGRFAAAASCFDPMMAAVAQRDFCHPVATGFVVDAIEVYANLGRVAEAERLIGPLSRAGEAGRRPVVAAMTARCRALVAAAGGHLAAALNEAELATGVAELAAVPFEAGRTLLIHGQLLRRSRKKLAARAVLMDSLRTFEGIGAPLWVARARAEFDRVGGRAAVAGQLTVTEQRMAELVAAGLTNREIANQCFVTGKTVEANLARVYRKLGVRSRAELAGRLHFAADHKP